jgi:hypothetical protein
MGGNETIASDYWKYIHEIAGKVPVVFTLGKVKMGKTPKWKSSRDDLDKLVKLEASPASAADIGKVLNCWLVEFEQYHDLLGVATFPDDLATAPKLDGVIVDARTTRPSKSEEYSRFDSNATLAHEIGHWLGMLHTFQDGVFADISFAEIDYLGIGSIDTDQGSGDRVADTIQYSEPNTGNPFISGKYPLNNQGRLCPFINIMDYCDDDACLTFTKHQAIKMEWFLRTYRPLLAGQYAVQQTGGETQSDSDKDRTIIILFLAAIWAWLQGLGKTVTALPKWFLNLLKDE